MTKRAMVLMRDVVYGTPARDLAETWNAPCVLLKGSAFQDIVDTVMTAAGVIRPNYPNQYVQITEVNFDADTAAQFMINLRLEQGDLEILAFWFSDELEAKVNAWSAASQAIEKTVGHLKSAKNQVSKLSKVKKIFNADLTIKSLDFTRYINATLSEFENLTSSLKSEIEAGLI